MQRNTENERWPGKLFWENLVREGWLTSPRIIAIMVDLLQQLGLQIRATDVSIRVQRNGTPDYGSGVIIRGR